MTTVGDISRWMNNIAPLALSESWDNTGLLLGDPAQVVTKLMTCLTLTPESVSEAVAEQASLVIAHHPLPFKPLSRITTDSLAGKLLWKLASAGIAVYSPHTAWDSADEGINALLANYLQLQNVQPLVPCEVPEFIGKNLGAGRVGNLPEPCSMSELSRRLCELIPDCRPRGVEGGGEEICRVAIACGSGGSLLSAGARAGCDLFLTGESTFHSCLEAQALGLSLLLIGHFASERFSMDHLAKILAEAHVDVQTWASRLEKDPIVILH